MDKQLFINFINYCKTHIKGDEKGEAQIFLDHFFIALGYEDGLKGAGADCEFRMHDLHTKSTSFADLVWPKRVLIEMKKKDEKLEIHLQQASSYWIKLAGSRPRYIILCNFDEFWIYDFDKNIYEPADKINLTELPDRIQAFSFLFPKPTSPVFGKDKEDITALAAEKIAAVYKSLIKRKIDKEIALRYCLQCVVTMFAEDVDLLPDKIFTRLIEECDDEKAKSYDLIGGLFREMNAEGITPSGRYKGVDYFDGGLFEKVYPLELYEHEINMLHFAAMKNWKNVNPAIFGSIFEKALESDERHKLGAHYTHEIDIKKIVDPVIVQPWNDKIEEANTLDDYYSLLDELSHFRVLDPACGSGNFLFIAFKEMKLLEKRLLSLVRDNTKKREDSKRLNHFLLHYKFVNTDQFYGIDIKPFAVELARVTLMVAKELTFIENNEASDNKKKPLPLDNMSKNIICADALLDENKQPRVWPEVEAIIGNPPYQSHANMKKEFGIEYVNKIWKVYPEISGKADFCVYWFFQAHKQLKMGSYAGLVGTNTIRQNFSREGSLDYIIKNGGTIINATSTEPWSGKAAVFVSIVSWKKGDFEGEKILYYPNSKEELVLHKIEDINSSLSLNTDVVDAKILKCNTDPKMVYKGQMHGHEGLFITVNEAKKLINSNQVNSEVVKPVLIGNNLLGNLFSQPKRFVIDFSGFDIIKASSYKEPFKIVELRVKNDREQKALEQEEANKEAIKKNPDAKVAKHHIGFYNRWWQPGFSLNEMIDIITHLRRYIVCSRVSSRPIFEFIDPQIRPNDALMVFCFDNDYALGIIHSSPHWEWWKAKCSTLKGDYRYTASSIWDTFPWPQNPNLEQVRKVAKAAKDLRDERNKIMQEYRMSLRDLYRLIEKPGKNPVRDLHRDLDLAVMEAYGFNKTENILTQLLELNLQVAEKEEKGEQVQSPGLPACVKNKDKFISNDCVKFQWEVELGFGGKKK